MAGFGTTTFDENRIELFNSAGTAGWRIVGQGPYAPNGLTFGDIQFSRSGVLNRALSIPSDTPNVPIAYMTGLSFGVMNATPAVTLHSTGSTVVGGLSNTTVPAKMGNSQINFWINEAGNALNFQVKYSTGAVKSGTVALS